MTTKNLQQKNTEVGQTLIETLAASFILVMGIASAVGLAVYSLNSTSLIAKQIVGVGLAREALDAFKNMRDTNWLKEATVSTDCYNYVTGANDDKCYHFWQNKSFDITDPGAKVYKLYTDPSAVSGFWVLKSHPNGNPRAGLDFDSAVSSASFGGFYKTDNGGQDNGSSDYYRQILVTNDNTTEPYNKTYLSRLKITVQVWWTDKRCPQTSTFPGEGKCGVQMSTYLTNWKNF